MNIHQAITEVMRQIGTVGKGDRNTFHEFNFRGIDRVLNHVAPALRAHGVTVTPELRTLESRDITTSKGKKEREITLTMAYTYTGPDGDSITAVVPGEASDSGDKAVSKAMSVALRTAHIQTFQIPTGDPDPDTSTTVRGADPVHKLKEEIWTAAKEKGWIAADESFVKLADEFAEWSTGGDIRTALADDLKAFRDHIKPVQRIQRRPQGATR